MISDNSDRMGHALNILTPFSESKDDCKEFPIVDVVVSFSREKSTGEVGARMEIAISICLEQDSSCGK